MKPIGPGNRLGFTDEVSQALAHGIEPTLDVVGLTTSFAKRLTTGRVKNRLISFPDIAEGKENS